MGRTNDEQQQQQAGEEQQKENGATSARTAFSLAPTIWLSIFLVRCLWLPAVVRRSHPTHISDIPLVPRSLPLRLRF